jgi:hypothetical protein
MPDYGTKSGSGVGARSTYRGGSGYTTSSSKSGSKASQRRKKIARQAAQRAEKALADQKARDAANKTSFGQQATANVQAAQQAAVQEAQRVAAANKFRQAEAQRANVVGAAAQQAVAQQAAARQAAAAAARRDANRPSVIAAQQAASRSIPRIKPQPKPEGMSLSRAKAGLYNLLPEFLRTDNKSGRTAKQEEFIEGYLGADARRDRRRRNKARRDQVADNVVPPITTDEVDPDRRPTDMPPEIIEDYYDRFPQYPGMGSGLGAFGYSPASLMFESQQGAGQVPYYMAAARNAMNPNLSPAFMNAARNYDILGGMQRVMPRPIEMMSARERGEIMDMGSNFSVPNYNSPYYQPSPQSQFDFFSNMVSGGGTPAPRRPLMEMFPEGPPARFGGPGKGAPRPAPQDLQSKAMARGIASLMTSGMFG